MQEKSCHLKTLSLRRIYLPAVSRRLRALPFAMLVACSILASGSAIIEKKWTGYSQAEMMAIARDRVKSAVAMMSDQSLIKSASQIPWDPSSPATWSPAVCEWVDKAFDLYHPQSGHGELRLRLFKVLDVIIHLDYPDELIASLDQMYHKRMDRAVEEIVSLDGVDGARIWKMYNMGFVVMTTNFCLAFDLHPGSVVSPLSDEQVQALAGRCDMILISHRHSDHWDKRVLDAFSARGKPVILPEEDFWDGPGRVLVRDSRKEPLLFDRIKVFSYPGHQFRSCACNLYIVELDGLVISHNGDMSTPHPWVFTLKRRHKVDVQMLNCWALPSMNARGQYANMIIVGHEYELGHDINGRRGLDETSEMLNKKFPRIYLAWGEHVTYPGPVQ
jgi:hypothetical protein